ncbi:PIG-L family deacetylase [Streptomyces sp. NPDC007945]|uniref:PIG-L family deacetylase n=1 Tax=Streptomyces sp. NPDC007945 TaxID=3364797 RepID=UPI0036F069A2
MATLLAAGTLAGVLTATAAQEEPAAGGPAAPISAAPRAAGAAPVSVVQFVSHPDDDLYFMNPDTAQSLADRTPLTTVYLTAGEANGVNARAARAAATAPDKPAYAEARQNGIRAAYAELVTGDRTSPWDRTAIRTAGGGAAELDTLRARPGVRLVWLQLREAGSPSGDRPHSLRGLWHGRIPALGSLRSSGTPVTADFAYSKEQVVATLTGLLDRFRPTYVRTLDPTPGTNAATGRLRDHQDHAYGARFAQAALDRYARRPGHPRVGVQSYLGYPNTELPPALDGRTAEEKLRSLRTYAWLDGTDHCGSPAGCGDLKMADRPQGRGWTSTVRYARGTSTGWLQADANGGLLAFGVQDGRLATWRRAAGGGAWKGPELLPGGGLDGGVDTVRLPDGRIAVFATRTTFAGPAGYRREVVALEQTAPGGRFGAWRSLGTPGKRDEADRTPDISAPAVTVDGSGRVRLFLRDGDHRLAGRERTPGGGWGPWRSLGGAGLHGDPVAATDAAGRPYVFAGTRTSVLLWTGGPGGRIEGPRPTGLPATTLALSAGPSPAGGGVRLWSREPGTGAPRAADFAGTARLAPVAPPSGGVAGFGPVSAADGVVAARSRTGRLAVAPLADGGAWRLSDFPLAGAPAAGPGGVAALGQDGHLHWVPTPADR